MEYSGETRESAFEDGPVSKEVVAISRKKNVNTSLAGRGLSLCDVTLSLGSVALGRAETSSLSRKVSRFRQNFVGIAKASLLAQVLSLIATPFLTRLYSPADYGALTLFSSLSSVLLAFATLRFDWSVPNASSRAQAVALMVIGFIALSVIGVTASVTLWLFASHLTFWRGFQALSPYLPVLPIALVGSGLQQLMQGWFIREGDLTAVSKSKITQGAVSLGLSIVGGILRTGAWGLIVSSVVAVWVGIGTLFRHASGFKAVLGRLSRKRIKATYFCYLRESIVSTLVALINTASLTVTPVLLSQFYSAVEVGWYVFVLRFATTPVAMFTTAIGQSFWAEAASLVRTDPVALQRLYLRLSRRLLMLGVPVAIMCLLGPLYISFIFGEAWTPAGYILAALAPLVLGQIVASPLSHLGVHRKQHWQFFWDVCRLTMLIVAILLSIGAKLPIALTALAISLVSSLMYVFLFRLNLLCIRRLIV